MFLQIFLRVLELGDGLLLFLRRLLALLFAAAFLIVQHGAGFLHFFGRGLEIFRGLGRDVLDVVTHILGAVHDFGLTLFKLGRVGGFALNFLRLGGDLFFQLDGFLDLANGLAENFLLVARGHQHAGEFLEKIAGRLLAAGGAEKFRGLQIGGGGFNRRKQIPVARALHRLARALRGRAVHFL